MRNTINVFLLISLLCLTGCRTTGYTVRIETDTLEYSEITRIEAILVDKGYNLEWMERTDNRTSPNNVMTLLEKKFSRDQVIYKTNPKDLKEYFEKEYNKEIYWWVGINLLYLKDLSKNIAQHVRINIYNQFIGGISPEIKTEINNISDLIYDDLSNKIGKDKIKIERKEWGPPIIY